MRITPRGRLAEQPRELRRFRSIEWRSARGLTRARTWPASPTPARQDVLNGGGERVDISGREEPAVSPGRTSSGMAGDISSPARSAQRHGSMITRQAFGELRQHSPRAAKFLAHASPLIQPVCARSSPFRACGSKPPVPRESRRHRREPARSAGPARRDGRPLRPVAAGLLLAQPATQTRRGAAGGGRGAMSWNAGSRPQ